MFVQLRGPLVAQMHEHNVFYDTFEAPGTSSGCVWKPSLPICLEIQCFDTHFEGTLNPYAQTLRVLRYFQSLRVSGSLSGRVWKVFVGCIPRNITF